MMSFSKMYSHGMAILIILSFAISLHSKEITCPLCTHVLLMTHNLPPEYRYKMFQIMVPALKLSGHSCEHGDIPAKQCISNVVSSATMVNKCRSRKTTMIAYGMKNKFPDADLEVRVFIRDCTLEPAGKDNCTERRTLDDTLSDDIKYPLQQLKTIWHNVTYFGQTCTY